MWKQVALGGRPQRGELEALYSELRRQRHGAEDRERQLECYAFDLRETFKSERRRTEELKASYVATVRALTDAVEARDAYTGAHTERVAEYGLELTRRIDPDLAANPQVEFGFLLHDVGKVAIPDGILRKAGNLGEEEQALMRRHAVIGFEILSSIEFLAEAAQIVRHHHERWDGHGYPDRLAGEEIPLAARIFSVADTLDAMTTDRPYRPCQSLARARAEICGMAGTQFDPAVVEALGDIPDEVLESIRAQDR